MQMTIQALQDELRIQRDLNQLFQQDSSTRTGEPCVAELTEENFQRLHAEHERQAKELFLLRKTLEEMELRIETQKQTLSARDESIKKLLEMLQSKGLSAKATEEDHERTRRLAEAEMHVHHLESLLEQKEKENNMLREVSDYFFSYYDLLIVFFSAINQDLGLDKFVCSTELVEGIFSLVFKCFTVSLLFALLYEMTFVCILAL